MVRSGYLAWASQRYGRVRFDLATSGMSAAPASLMGGLDPGALSDPGSWTALRSAIALYNDVSPDEAVAALGTTHAVWLACAALTHPGDEVLVETPGYEPLARIAESVGATVAPLGRPAGSGFALDPERIARAMSPRTRVVVVTDPHNPSGLRAPADTLRAAADIVARRGAHLLVDEVYAPFDTFVDGRGIFPSSARKLAPNVIAAGSLGKSYGLGAARVGWMLGPPDVVRLAEDVVLTTAGALPIAHAAAGIRAFGRIGALAERARRELGAKRERVASWAAALGLPWSGPSTGLFGFARLPGSGDLTTFVERMAREREVLVAPGAFFGEPEGIRIAWSVPAEALDEGLARLGAALGELPASLQTGAV
jgi:aspartate/methionine/tyrosine aminotransferase